MTVVTDGTLAGFDVTTSLAKVGAWEAADNSRTASFAKPDHEAVALTDMAAPLASKLSKCQTNIARGLQVDNAATLFNAWLAVSRFCPSTCL